MLMVIELEVKVEGEKVDYIDDTILANCQNEEQALKILNERIDKLISDGFYNVIQTRTKHFAYLSNGGSYCKKIFIRLN